MVHLELGRPNSSVLNAARALADRFQASVLGIAASQPFQVIYGDAAYSGEVIEQNSEELERQFKEAEKEFRAAFRERPEHCEWRSMLEPVSLADYLAQEACAANLIITGVNRSDGILDGPRHVDVASLIMEAGRPVLIVPPNVIALELGEVVIGWKDSREARRAVLDALPYLKLAARVTVVEFVDKDDIEVTASRLGDIKRWLAQNDVEAVAVALPSDGDTSKQLNIFAGERSVDLIVAGAYGHTRLREWVLGGVTEDLLLRANRCVLVSH
jgi:nucleotide-binding universal stress UspA family protein